jgi:hypothetical protein
MEIPVEAMHGVLRCALPQVIFQDCDSGHCAAQLIAAGVRLAPTIAASSAAHVFDLGDTESRTAGMTRRAFEVAPDGIHSIAVADSYPSSECTQCLNDVVRTQVNSIRVARVEVHMSGPCATRKRDCAILRFARKVDMSDACAKLMRVCAVWGPTSLRDLCVDTLPDSEADPAAGIEEALTHCTGGLTHLRVPHAAVLTPAHARSLAAAPPAWMATVRLLSVAIASDSDLAALAEAPRLLPSLNDLTLCVRTDTLSPAAWRGALRALLPQLTAFALEGSHASLADPTIFTSFWDHPAGPEGASRRPLSVDVHPPTAAAPAAIIRVFPLETLTIRYTDVCHGPLLSLIATHAPNLNAIVLTGVASPGMADALAAMSRCRSLTLLLRELTDDHIARILRGGMGAGLRSVSLSARNPVFLDVAAFDGVVCPKVRKATFLPYNDCTRSVFPNARWPEEVTAAPGL